MTSELDLIRAAQAGDAVALGSLLEAHRPRLYATAIAILGDRTRAEDAVQDAFLVALQRLRDLRNPAAAGAWLHAIVRNECRMRLRARRELPGDVEAITEAQTRDVEEALERLALRDWLWTALEALPADLRATVMLRNFTPHASYQEIATILGVPVGTVRSRLNQAKRRLADALLATATTAHRDQAALVAERESWWEAVVAEIGGKGRADFYSAEAVPEVLVEAPSLGYRVVGVADHARGMVESVAAGVRVHLTGIVASEDVTIIEADYENPAEDPRHCPATHTEVRFHPQGRATRIILYYAETGENRPTELIPD